MLASVLLFYKEIPPIIIRSSRSAQLFFTLTLILFWMTYGLMFAFAAKFLQTLNFSNTLIGLTLGCSYAASALLQPLIADFLTKKQIPQIRWIRFTTLINLTLSLALWLLPGTKGIFVLLMVLMLSLQSAMEPSINSLTQTLSRAGFEVSYSLGRACSGLSYALMSWGMGLLLLRVSARHIPGFTILGLAGMLALTSLVSVPEKARIETELTPEETSSVRSLVFYLLLCGIVCLSFGHTFIDNFMLQIMEHVGGNSSHLGTALALAALCEMPAMLLYGHLSKKVSDRSLLLFAAWMWGVRNLLVLLARNPYMVYGAEIMQFLTYAFYVPAVLNVTRQMLPEEQFLKGLSLTGSAFTIGSVTATFVGGPLLDLAGMKPTLILIFGITLLGAVILTVQATLTKKRHS